MRPQDIEKLLGGYATGTLTEEEREALFKAALSDQNLFNALADEQALKELLDNPSARRQLLHALEKQEEPLFRRFSMWLGRPASWAVAGSVAAAVLVVVIVSRVGERPAEPDRTLVAKRQVVPLQEAVPAPQPVAPPPAQEQLKDEDRRTTEPVATEKKRAIVTETESKPQALVAGNIQVPPTVPAPPSEQAEVGAVEREVQGQTAEPMAFAERVRRDEASAKARETYKAAPAPGPPTAGAEPAKEEQARLKTARGALVVRTAAGRATSEADVIAQVQQQAPSIQYRILRRGDDGSYAEVDPQATFRAGDRIRLTVEPGDDGYLYVSLRDAAGASRLLFERQVQGGSPYTIPTSEAIDLGGPPGERKLIVILSRQPAPGIEGAKSSLLRGAEPTTRTRLEIPLKSP
jgi:hypothetical protein